jgi:iron complex outermembrane receptor protein
MTQKRLLPVITLFMLLAIQTFAQQKSISGKVSDNAGAPVSGATVSVKGTNQATQTSADGTYKLNVAATAKTLVFSAVGYKSVEKAISGTTMDASLEVSQSNLNEVVVVGYGTRKVKDLTGSVVSLTEKNFNKGIISSPEQLLQGRTAGVTVTTASGEPGAGVSINIRGTASLRSSNNPLFVVDGVPLDGGGTTGGGIFIEGNSSAKNPLSFINPNDIESISILKDASSAAIYGARGANGVVIITTKGGKGKGGFNFSMNSSLSKTAKRYDVAGAQEFMYGVKQAVIASGVPAADASVAVASLDKGFNTDWQDQIFQTGASKNYNLSWGFSKKGTSLRLSGSYDDQQGIVKTTDLKRATLRANLSQQVTDKLKFDATFNYSNIRNSYAAITNNAGYQGSLIGAAISFNPTFPVYNADGTFFDNADNNRNPVEILNYYKDNDAINRILTNLSGTYKVTKNINYKLTFGYDQSNSERLGFADPRVHGSLNGGNINIRNKEYKQGSGSGIQGNGRGSQQFLELNSMLLEHTLTYDKAFNNGSVINAFGGFSYQKTSTYYRANQRYGLASATAMETNIDKYKYSTDTYGDSSRYELQSFFGRVNYTIKDKYFLTGTFRRDGSSKFAKGNKYGNFPAIAAKWRLSDESFFSGLLSKAFSDFNIRANWGITGNQEFPPYSSLAIQQAQFNGGNSIQTNSNPNLKWESTTTQGIGLDFTLAGGRVKGTVDYFHKSTKDLLFLASYPQPAASANRWVNLPGNVINKGLEIGLELGVVKPSSGNFSWDINYNMTFLKNEVTNFGQNVVNTGEVSGQGLSGAFAQTIVNGSPLFTFKMPVFQRFDADGNGVYANGAQDQLVGSALPKFTAGLTNSFTYKNWNASVFMNAVTGFYIYNNTANALFLKGSLKTAHNVTKDVINSIESPINPGSVSTRFLEKGDFLRLANANLGYTFKLKNKTIKTMNVALSGQNLALFTNYSGLDPEVDVNKQINGVPSKGFDYTAYPKARTVTLGVNLGF